MGVRCFSPKPTTKKYENLFFSSSYFVFVVDVFIEALVES